MEQSKCRGMVLGFGFLVPKKTDLKDVTRKNKGKRAGVYTT